MRLFSIIMIGIAANLDNLGIGLSYGVRRIKIPWLSNLVIAVMSGTAAIISSIGGHFLSCLLPVKISNRLGGGIVAVVGIWVILTFFRGNSKRESKQEQKQDNNMNNLKKIVQKPHQADIDYSGHISEKEAFLLGIALAVNCLATGLGAGLTGLNFFSLTVSVMFFSLLTIYIGVNVGKRYAATYLGDRATLVAGLILIVIGIYEAFV